MRVLVFQGFMTYLVEPLFGEWARFSNTRLSQTMLGHLGLNKASWKGVQREQCGSGDDADPAFEEMDSDILPQEPRLSWPQSSRQNCLFSWYLHSLIKRDNLPAQGFGKMVKRCQHYLFPSFPLTQTIWSRIFLNCEIWPQSNMPTPQLVFVRNLEYAKHSSDWALEEQHGASLCHTALVCWQNSEYGLQIWDLRWIVPLPWNLARLA